MANFSGKSSTYAITSDSYYKNMPEYNFKMYFDSF